MWGENNPQHVDRYMAEGRYSWWPPPTSHYGSSNYQGNYQNYNYSSRSGASNRIKQYFNKAFKSCKQQKYKIAIKYYKKVLKINSKVVEAWCNMGVAYGSLKKYKKELKCIKRAIAINPKLAEVWRNLGGCYGNLKQYSEALKCFKKAHSINKNWDVPLYGMGLAYYNLKDYRNAINNYNEALKLNPNNVGGWISSGICYMYLSNYELAMKCYDKAFHLNSECASVCWYNKACLESLRNNKIKSLEYLKKSFELNKEYIKKSMRDDDFKNIHDSREYKDLVDKFH